MKKVITKQYLYEDCPTAERLTGLAHVELTSNLNKQQDNTLMTTSANHYKISCIQSKNSDKHISKTISLSNFAYALNQLLELKRGIKKLIININELMFCSPDDKEAFIKLVSQLAEKNTQLDELSLAYTCSAGGDLGLYKSHGFEPVY